MQTQAQTALTDHITTNMPNPTVGDVIGGRKTIIQNYPALASSLPNRIIVEGARYDKLPTQLQQQVSYILGKDELGRPYAPTTFAYSTLNNEKVTLSFKPATADDEAALLALLPEGEITDLSQLPSSIPSYLIDVIPELKVNGEVRIAGQPMRLGDELVFNTKIRFRGINKLENYDYKVIVGSFLSVNVVSSNVSSSKLEQLSTRLSNTASIDVVNNQDNMQLLNKENMLGDMFYAGSLGYFAELITIGRTISEGAIVNHSLAAGYGTFGYVPRVDYIFGFPIGIRPGVVSLDIPMNIVSASSNGDKEKQKQFVTSFGYISSILEHSAPEQLFDAGGVVKLDFMSAMKGIQKAQQEGQKIYQITPENIANTLPHINASSTTINEIIASVNVGYSVTIHESPISVPGYTGMGYIILDNETGEGAYKITGGGNGGEGEIDSRLVGTIDTSAGVATGSVALFMASIETTIGTQAATADGVVAAQKMMGYMASVLAGIKLLYDLVKNPCVSQMALFLIMATFVILTAFVVTLAPILGGMMAVGAGLASSALPTLLLGLAGSFGVDQINKMMTKFLTSC